ncbi:glycosyltransferase family 2 protein [Winogradskyella sp.]|uniref:glycosyltransferase family 2 protein n=1 Tax=Winogradskyella sp. TaxID=1883156 RepID=UPI002620A6A9|nr:glycosyltransferase family 2 protein [Winogradskyella sp.]
MNPLVSVIIPTYNRVDYLKFTIDSVINQTYPYVEIIVVDDGSSNNHTEILCKDYSHVNYIKIENSGGPCKPRNIGIDKANGKYLAFLDDDDIWLPNKLEQQVRVLEENSEYALTHCYCDVIDSDGVLTGDTVGRPGSPEVKHGDVKLKMIGNWTLMMPTPLVTKTLVDSVGYFNTDMPQTAADVEFWTRCSFKTKFYYQDAALVQYRKHNNNMSSDKRPYVNVPLYLKQIIDKEYNTGSITKIEYKLLNTQICKSQAKHIKINMLRTFMNLSRLNPIWMINLPIVKIVIKRLLK